MSSLNCVLFCFCFCLIFSILYALILKHIMVWFSSTLSEMVQSGYKLDLWESQYCSVRYHSEQPLLLLSGLVHHLHDGLGLSLEDPALAQDGDCCSLTNVLDVQFPAPQLLRVGNICSNPSCYPSTFDTDFQTTVRDITLSWSLYLKLATEAISTLAMDTLLTK